MWWKRIAVGMLLGYAVLITVYAFHWHPLPIPDWGHRVFLVPDKEAAKITVKILEATSSLREWFSFDAGPTHQTVLSDGQTVILWLDKDFREREQGQNALSIVTDDPVASAAVAVNMLKVKGYQASIMQDLPELGKKLVRIESNRSFDHWLLIYRLHALAMGKPKTYKLLE